MFTGTLCAQEKAPSEPTETEIVDGFGPGNFANHFYPVFTIAVGDTEYLSIDAGAQYFFSNFELDMPLNLGLYALAGFGTDFDTWHVRLSTGLSAQHPIPISQINQL